MNTYNHGTQLGLFLARASLGLYLTLAGWGKVVTEVKEGIGTFLNGPGYTAMTPDWLPWWFAQPYGYALPWLELVVGGLIVFGLVTRFAATGAFLMLTSFTIVQVISSESIRGVKAVPDMPPPPPFTSNYMLSAVFFLLIFTGAGSLSLDRLIFGKGKTGEDA